jgi:hypothetical protein
MVIASGVRWPGSKKNFSQVMFMDLPFTSGQFLSVFVAYNSTIWPIQTILSLLAIIAFVLCFRTAVPSQAISSILSFLWLWTGVVYHWMFFSTINKAAYVFGTLFVAQAALFFFYGVLKPGLRFRFDRTWQAYTGALLILYALFIYPAIGTLLGHVYPASPTFGAPCPTTIFTFGLLLWTVNRLKWYLYILPLVWSLIGFTAALKLGFREDIGLLVSGLVGTAILAMKGRTPNAAANA